MTRRKLLPLVGLAVIAVVTALAVVLVASVGGEDSTTSPRAPEPPGGNPPVYVDAVPGSGLPTPRRRM